MLRNDILSIYDLRLWNDVPKFILKRSHNDAECPAPVVMNQIFYVFEKERARWAKVVNAAQIKLD